MLILASGGLRNIVKTIADLPATATQRIHAAINDREFAVVARNAILLLFALNSPNSAATNSSSPLDTAEALIHLWYSAFLPAKVVSTVQEVVKPLIADVCAKIAHKDQAVRLGKSWEFPSGRSLRLVLRGDQ